MSDGGTISDMPTVADLTKAVLSFSSDRDLASYSLMIGAMEIAASGTPLLEDTSVSINILGNNAALSEGVNEALLTITDEASNISKHTFLINRDTTAPESTVITLGNASLNTDGTYGISLTGTREPGVDVFVSVTDVDSLSQFDPLTISGLKLWLDASDMDGDNETTDNPSNGSSITTWTDKSGNGNHGVSIASPGQPIYTTGALNSHGVIEFDGINDGMSLGDITLESDYTIFIINRYSGFTKSNIGS